MSRHIKAFFSGAATAFDMGGARWSRLPSVPRVRTVSEALEVDRRAMVRDFGVAMGDFVDARTRGSCAHAGRRE